MMCKFIYVSRCDLLRIITIYPHYSLPLPLFAIPPSSLSYGCFKIFGGTGCSANESPVPARFLVIAALLYCYVVNFYLSYLPILRGKKRSFRDLFL